MHGQIQFKKKNKARRNWVYISRVMLYDYRWKYILCVKQLLDTLFLQSQRAECNALELRDIGSYVHKCSPPFAIPLTVPHNNAVRVNGHMYQTIGLTSLRMLDGDQAGATPSQMEALIIHGIWGKTPGSIVWSKKETGWSSVQINEY